MTPPAWEWNAARTRAQLVIGKYRLRVFRIGASTEWVGQLEHVTSDLLPVLVLHATEDQPTAEEAARLAVAALAEEVCPAAAFVINPPALDPGSAHPGRAPTGAGGGGGAERREP